MAQASFGRKWLAGIIRSEDLSPEEKEQQIMDGHIAVTDAIKDDRDKYKAEADKAAELQKQLDEKSGDDFKEKYEKEHQAFEEFKKQTAQNAEVAKVKAAYRQLLADEGISEKRLDAIIKVTDLSAMKLDADGNLTNADDLRTAIKTDWGEFIPKKEERGAKIENPPKQDSNTFDTMSLSEKMAFANQNPTDPAVTAWLSNK